MDRLASAFRVTDFAVAAIAGAARAARRLAALHEPKLAKAEIAVDPRLASVWFGSTIAPIGWTLPAVWDSIAGIYPCGDRSVRLHTNAPHHKRAALAVLECSPDRESVSKSVATWDPFDLEAAVVSGGGVAAALRSRAEWLAHPQGAAVAREPRVDKTRGQATVPPRPLPGTVTQPLRGVKVLDLTRVLAGPVATRLLAGLGADVVRVDPPDWNEPGIAAEVNLGKRCARLDLAQRHDRVVFERLLAEADILVHGYRPGALDGLGYDAASRRAMNPGLVDVSLNAWGNTGPWADRRGFDSIVQIASGVAHHGMVAYGAGEPRPLPVQALDHATGYTLAAAALDGWAERCQTGSGSTWRTSLAAHAEWLWDFADTADLEAEFSPLKEADLAPRTESTTWGPVRRARPPFRVADVDLAWPSGATDHGTSSARWATTLGAGERSTRTLTNET